MNMLNRIRLIELSTKNSVGKPTEFYFFSLSKVPLLLLELQHFLEIRHMFHQYDQ